MATTFHGVSGLATTSLRARLRYAFDSFLAWRADRRRQAEILRELAKFDDRDLRDLAISRYDFAAIARGDFRR